MPLRMRSLFIERILFLGCMLGLVSCSHDFQKAPVRKSEHMDWTISNENTDSSARITMQNGRVPGFVQLELLNRSMLNRFSSGTNPEMYAAYDSAAKQTWNYQTQLFISDSLYRFSNIDLVFEGIDTFSEIYINDSLLSATNNMFRTWRIAAKRFLKPGSNIIRVRLLPVEREGILLKNNLSYALPASDPVSPLISPFVRKAPYQFGWDWAPRCLTTGIWRPVSIEAYDGLRIKSMHVKLVELADSLAWMDAEVELANDRILPDVIIKVGDSFRQIRLGGRDTAVRIPFQVNNPRLWWPSNLGDQHLYEFNAKAFVNGYLVDSVSIRSGIRSSELVMEPDSIGTSFYFRINGRPVFIQGANYVPNGHFPGQEGEGKRLQLLKDAAAVGMNMIRVWGGGVYEDDRFYEICDSLGLMVWQDFMFACAMYPSDTSFMENVKQEVSDQLLRLRNHPSVVLFCGNNESDVAWKNWGWQQQYGLTPSDSIAIRKGYEKLFLDLVPDLIGKWAPNIPYVHTSPLSNWGKRQNFNHLNMHYWGVWHGEEPIDSFRVNVPRFMSEYGMQSYPSFDKLLHANNGIPPELGDGFLNDRQKSYKGNKLLIRYIEQRYGRVKSSEELSYLSQLHQADAMSMAIESHRLNFGRCMGTLYWQLNDVWDGASWSTIESDGIWKAAHYGLRRLYNDHLAVIQHKNDSIFLKAQKHCLDEDFYEYVFIIKDYSGKKIYEDTGLFFWEGQAPVDILSKSVKELLIDSSLNQVYLIATFKKDETICAEKKYFFDFEKELTFGSVNFSCRELDSINDKKTIEIISDEFALGAMLDFQIKPFWTDDNFLVLERGVPVTIHIDSGQDNGCKNLKIKGLKPQYSRD